MAIKDGDKVKISYTGKLDNGEVFDSSDKHGHPLEFEVGKGQIIKGLEDGIKGMEKNEEKDIKVKSDDAYGPYREELVQRVPKSALPQNIEAKPGMILMVGLGDGQQVPAKVKEVTDNEIVLDLNHPLAGKDLNFSIKILDVM